MDANAIKAAFSSAVPSIRTPFTKEGDIDFDALKNMVEFDIQAGATGLVLTLGDSLFALLSEREITEITKVVAEQTRKRAAVAACTGYWNTRQCAEFAQYAKGVGADILMLFASNWYSGIFGQEEIIAHYKLVSSHMPVMANTAVLAHGGHKMGLDVTKQLLEEVPNVIAAKADVQGEYDRKTCLIASEKWAIFSGGTKQFHMELYPYGCKGHMSTFITFKPEIARKYWNAIKESDLKTAIGVIKEFDYPFFEVIRNLTGGFDAGIHGIMEIFGLAKRWRRKPYYSLHDDEMDKLRQFFREKKLV